MTPLRRRSGEDQYGASETGGQWPPQPQQGYGDDYQAAPQPMQPGQGYHFPPDAQPASGYSNPQLLGAAQQWPHQGEPQPYDVAYQPYGDNDPSPFAGRAPHQHHGYTDNDPEFSDGYYEDEEPRRGRRWFLIAAALIGAIGVGGALAYTYRSMVAPKARVAATKTEPVKVKVPSAPVKVAEDPPPAPKTASVDSLPAEDPPPGDVDQGPRKIKVIPVGPGGGQSPSTVTPPPSGIPGLSIYQPPKGEVPPAPPAKEKAPPPGGRLAIGTLPPSPPVKEAKEKEEEEAPEPLPPPVKGPKIAAPKVPSAPKAPPSSGGLGYVAVLKSEKSSIDAVKTVADLQQRYPEVLSDKSFDVQEADLSARNLGTMYRVVVGPPGSHNAATTVCTQLKAAGYVGCWVKEY